MNLNASIIDQQVRALADKLKDQFADRLNIKNDEPNGAQVVIATLLFRIAENKRKRPPAGAPEFLRYGSCFLGMLMGKYLLCDMGTQLDSLDHRNFTQAKDLAEQNGEGYFQKAVTEVQAALSKLYGGQSVSLQRLSVTFRRGDLIEELNTQPSLPLAQPAI